MVGANAPSLQLMVGANAPSLQLMVGLRERRLPYPSLQRSFEDACLKAHRTVDSTLPSAAKGSVSFGKSKNPFEKGLIDALLVLYEVVFDKVSKVKGGLSPCTWAIFHSPPHGQAHLLREWWFACSL